MLNASRIDEPPQLALRGIRSFWCLVCMTDRTFLFFFMFLPRSNEMVIHGCWIPFLKMLVTFQLWVFLGVKSLAFLGFSLFGVGFFLLFFSLRFIKFLRLTFKNICFYIKI